MKRKLCIKNIYKSKPLFYVQEAEAIDVMDYVKERCEKIKRRKKK